VKEKDLQKAIKDYIRLKGGVAIKFYAGGLKFNDRWIPQNKEGVADILGVYKGKALALEVKVKGNKPTVVQENFIANWRDAGGIGKIVYSLDEVVSLLNEIDKETQPSDSS